MEASSEGDPCLQTDRRSGAGALEMRRGLVPVHRVPPGLEIVGAAGLVLEIVGVLPHIDADDGPRAVEQWRGLERGARALELAVLVDHEPRPAGAEAAGAGGV